MRKIFFGLLASILLCGEASSQQAPAPDPQRMITGVWRIAPAGIYVDEADGTRSYPFGKDGTGRFIFTADGFAANFIEYAHRPNCAAGTSPRQCTAEEATAAFKSASSYQFRYRLEPDQANPLTGTMFWDVDYSGYPNWQGQTLPRRYEIQPGGDAWAFTAPFPSNPKLGLKAHLEREPR